MATSLLRGVLQLLSQRDSEDGAMQVSGFSWDQQLAGSESLLKARCHRTASSFCKCKGWGKGGLQLPLPRVEVRAAASHLCIHPGIASLPVCEEADLKQRSNFLWSWPRCCWAAGSQVRALVLLGWCLENPVLQLSFLDASQEKESESWDWASAMQHALQSVSRQACLETLPTTSSTGCAASLWNGL